MKRLLLILCVVGLGSVACGAKSPPSPPAGTEAAEGAKLFTGRFNCNSCHPGAHKGVGPALVGQQFRRDRPTDASIVEQVRNGGGGMPSFPPEVMSDEELHAIVAYLRWLNAQDTKSSGGRGG